MMPFNSPTKNFETPGAFLCKCLVLHFSKRSQKPPVNEGSLILAFKAQTVLNFSRALQTSAFLFMNILLCWENNLKRRHLSANKMSICHNGTIPCFFICTTKSIIHLPQKLT